jgi:hypothetical protein
MIGSLITKPMLIGAAAVTAVLMLGLVSVSGYAVGQAKEIGKLRSEARGSQVALAQSEIDLRWSKAEASDLREVHAACLDEIRLGQDDQLRARVAIDRLTADVRRAADNVRLERETIFRGECQGLAALDVAAACPSLAGSLRRRAAEVSATRTD